MIRYKNMSDQSFRFTYWAYQQHWPLSSVKPKPNHYNGPKKKVKIGNQGSFSFFYAFVSFFVFSMEFLSFFPYLLMTINNPRSMTTSTLNKLMDIVFNIINKIFKSNFVSNIWLKTQLETIYKNKSNQGTKVNIIRFESRIWLRKKGGKKRRKKKKKEKENKLFGAITWLKKRNKIRWKNWKIYSIEAGNKDFWHF